MRKLLNEELSDFYEFMYRPYIDETAMYRKGRGLIYGTLAEHVSRCDVDVYIIERNGKPAGFMITEFVRTGAMREPAIYLSDIYVKPNLRRKGLGSSAFRELLETVYAPVFLAAPEGNAQAEAFWDQAASFRDVETTTPRPEMAEITGSSALYCFEKAMDQCPETAGIVWLDPMVLEQTIDCLGLSRSRLCGLVWEGVRTIGGVMELEYEDALSFRNIGVVSAAEIKEAMEKKGLSVKW